MRLGDGENSANSGNQALPPISQSILFDTPLSDPKQDRLGRTDFTRFLAQSILEMNPSESFVIALNGPWGCGKTTIVNFLRHYLIEQKQEQNQLLVVNFNPWWFSGREQLLQQFFNTLKVALGKQNVPKDLKILGNKLGILAHCLEPLKFLPKVGWFALVCNKVFGIFSKILKTISESMVQDVHEIRKSIDATLRSQKSRILVVIDDIDRLTAEEICQVFQIVKAVADFPRTVYLLVFDRSVVARALEELQKGSGEAYLEKIVQVPFDVPLPDRDGLRRYFFEQLDEVLRDSPEELWDQTEWGNLYWDCIDTFIETPRDIKRLMNAMRLTYPTVKKEVNPIDFIGIQTLRLFMPELYAFVASSKDQFCKPRESSGDSHNPAESTKKILEGYFGIFSQKKREATKNLILKLFPQLNVVYGGGTYGDSWLPEWRRRRRVCSPDYFDRYFMLSLASDDISSTEIHAVLDAAGDSKTFGENLLLYASQHRQDGTTRLRMLLERIEDFAEKNIPESNIESICTAIFNVGDLLIKEEDRAGVFDLRNDIRLLRVVYKLLRRLPQVNRYEMLRRIFSSVKSVSLVTHAVVVIGQEHGKNGGSAPVTPEAEWIVSTDQLAALEILALQNIRLTAQDNRLHAIPDFGFLLYQLAAWGSEEEAKNYVSRLIKDDSGLCDYLAGFLQRTYSFGMSDRVSKSQWRVHIPSVMKFLEMDAKVLLPRCQKILKDAAGWLNDRRRTAVSTFIREISEPKDEFGRAHE